MYLFRYWKLFLLWMMSHSALAHPHTYIDLKAKFLVSDNQLTGIAFDWRLDEITSLSLTYDMFQNLSYPQAMKQIAEELTHNMQVSAFFTHLTHNNQPVTFHLQQNSSKATQNKLNTIFSFILDLDQPISLINNQLVLTTYEPSYYVSMTYENSEKIDSTELPSNCQMRLLNPNYSQALKDYAMSLDLSGTSDRDLYLGKHFTQEVILSCQ